jgi:hypothetical protein
LRLRDEHDGTIRGYFYADNSNNVGILDNTGNWKMRVVNGDYALFNGSSARAAIFYDRENTSYYTDPHATSNINHLKVNGDLTVADHIYHKDDTDTYMEFNAANTWRVVVGGSQKLLVNSAGVHVNNGSLETQRLGSGDSGIYFDTSYDAVVPWRYDTSSFADNYLDLGKYNVRWDDVFATNGTINTSDRNEKQDIEELSEAEERVAVACKGLLKKFRWKSAVEEKGEDARIHFGIIAQDLQAAFEAEGLDAGRYGMFTSDTWTDEESGEEQTRMGVRYSELLAFIISAI